MSRVLHIEDDPRNRLLVRKLLAGEGHEVVDATDGLEGVRAALTQRPDLVLVDPLGTRTLSDAGVLSLAGWTPYAGRQVRGAIRRVLLRGVTIAVEGKPTEARIGQWVPGPGRKRTQEWR